MNIKPALRSDRSSNALIGLSVLEFQELVPTFSQCLTEAMMERKGERKRKPGAGQKGKLPTVEEKLFCVLMYAKTYPTYDVTGFFSGMERTRACRWIQFLLPVLEKALGRKLVLPKRQIRSVEEFLEAFPEAKDVFIDGTERRTQKPVNPKRRKKLYSGKKKATTRKNVVVSDEKKRVLVLTPTKSGRRHDKRLFDKAIGGRNIPENVGVWTDTGFIGVEKDHKKTVMPKKGTKNHKLTEEDKSDNRLISGIRVLSEHTIAGIKRFGATTNIYRNRLPNFDDRIMLVSAGLWNYHLSFSSNR